MSSNARRRERPAPSGPVLVDFESRSRANLKKRGGRLYWEDPSSEPLCAVLYDVEAEEWSTWEPGDEPLRLDVAVAHNAQHFDRHAAAASGWRVREWEDSASAARRAGLPGALDKLGKRWLGREKDKAGNKLTVGLSRPSRAKARLGQLPELTPEIRERVLSYCRDDVEIMAESWERLVPWFDVDAETCAVDRVVNDRGIYLDKDLVRALQKQFERQQERAVRKAAKRLGWTPEVTRKVAMSPSQLCNATGLPNAQKETLADPDLSALTREQRERAEALIPVRKALASVVPGKLTAALNMVSDDDRLRDMFLYYGAHTGRWSGRGLQPHNLNRISFEDEAKRIGWGVDDYIGTLIDGALTGGDLTKHQVSGLLRSVLTASPGRELVVLDYSGIEARANAWAAGDEDALDVFRALDAGTGPDPYRVMAGRYLFGVDVAAVTKEQRGLGKIAELMLGYGAGADKFAESCAKGGADLETLGVDAAEVVRTYRTEAHPAIAQLWKSCEKAFAAACQGRTARAGRWAYEAHPALDGNGGVDVWCVLPSGRPIVYCDARAKRVQRRAKNGNTFQAWDLSYQGRSPWREHVYGGLLTENAVQAFCRDLLADALVRCEAAGLDPVGHVHDEAIGEVDKGLGAEGLEEMRHIMGETAPRWAKGLPIRLDGFHSERYRK
jgi:DNA polymerase bacteriophage-type